MRRLHRTRKKQTADNSAIHSFYHADAKLANVFWRFPVAMDLFVRPIRMLRPDEGHAFVGAVCVATFGPVDCSTASRSAFGCCFARGKDSTLTCRVHPSSGPSAGSIRGFKVVHVFDVSQTEGDTLRECGKITGDPSEHMESLETSIREHRIELRYEQIAGGADGLSKRVESSSAPT